MERGDSDGEDAMAYFLPNGIADDSPPKRSTFGQSGFGSIGARYGAGSLAASPSSTQFGSSSLYSGGISATSSTRESAFSLSELGGEVHRPQSDDRGDAIGGGRNPFSFSRAFSSLAAKADSMGRSTGLFDFKRTSGGFRADEELFAPESSTRGGASLFGGPTLNANAPAFMASSTKANQEQAHYADASPTSWPPASHTKPRRVLHAPPGLSMATEDTPLTPRAPSSGMGDDGASIARAPPGLLRPNHSSPFRGYSTPTSSTASSSASIFASGSSPFGTPRQPHYPAYLTSRGSLDPEPEYKSALSELNARSMSVDEIQSNLEATALAAANDAMDEGRQKKDVVGGYTTPRGSRRTETGRGKSPYVQREDRNRSVKSSPDPRLETPTRRDVGPSQQTGLSSPASKFADRRGRNVKSSSSVETTPRTDDGSRMDAGWKTARRPRGGIYAAIDARTTRNAGTPIEVTTNAPYRVTVRKKPPSSVSSVGSDDQLLSIATLLVDEVEENIVSSSSVKAKDLHGEQKTSSRTSKGRKSGSNGVEKKPTPKRQLLRDKPSIPPASPEDNSSSKNEGEKSHAGSDADASGADSPVKVPKVSKSKIAAKSPPPVPSSSESKNISTPVKSSQKKKKATVESVEIEPTLEHQATVDTSTITSDENLQEQMVVERPTDEEQVDYVEVPSPVDSSTDKTPESEKPALVHLPSGSSQDEILTGGEVANATFDEPSTPPESDSGSEIPDVQMTSSRTVPSTERKAKKEKIKRDKVSERKKSSAVIGKATKKEKRESSSSGKGELIDDEPLFMATPAKKPSPSITAIVSSKLRSSHVFVKRSIVAIWSSVWFVLAVFADRVNLKGILGTGLSYLESFLAVTFSVILLLSLHGASWFIRIHRVAFRAVLTHRHVGFCFAFLYAFPFLVQYVFPWAPPWAPVCLWYAFLVQLFCTSGPSAMVATFRVILPLVFLVEGISHHSFLLDLNGAELLLASFILSAMKTGSLSSPIFLLSFAVQSLSAIFLGSEWVVQWFQTALALYSLHAMASTEDDWAGLGDDEDDASCRQMSVHHSIADYNYYPAPSVPSVQKTKRLDRRALAYVRGRKLR